MKFINHLFNSRFWALMVKEMHQILRDKRLLFLLIVLPTVQLLIYGFAINPEVHNLKMGIIDYAKTYTSRELISTLTENGIFIAHYSNSEQTVSHQLQTGQISVGLIIPPEFNRDLHQERTTQVQVLVDAVNANTAGIARSYIAQIINHYSRQIEPWQVPAQVQPQITFLYNPGLINSWFFVSGVMGLILCLVSTIVASATVVREKETGTLEQLLMTPTTNWQILSAKVLPLFLLLLGDVILLISLAKLIFKLPLRSNFLVFLAVSGLYILSAIGIGILIGTMFYSQQQTQLISFSINVPLSVLSGTITPIESMPQLIQYLSLLNPLRHYLVIVRGLLLKGVSLDVLWPNVIALLGFTTILLLVSINRFRSQLKL
ncbi:ABC transporter permease [Nostoc flagelliforme FACHB-838]|uniref:Transport permease protein n=1 Tax=Nostoc flagelliforme FACHB-838 TaxID=2692904 RepID=A0ABR8E1W2_9NOSO|nr:ABC transporter permease [Nostoc flagelliforme]MBD2534583.1 ABC transporter permease [Nostoc flagelliforme FACHB-838]